MDIGDPKRILTIEPIEDPVPARPAPVPEPEREQRPLEPVELATQAR